MFLVFEIIVSITYRLIFAYDDPFSSAGGPRSGVLFLSETEAHGGSVFDGDAGLFGCLSLSR